MTVMTSIFENPTDLADAAARVIADRIAAAGLRPFLLGCPGGRSAAATYLALATEVRRRDLDLSRLVIVMMDDYLVPGENGRLRRERPDAPHSCERFAREQIVAPLNEAASGHGIPSERVWLPEPDEADRYDDRIAEAGGVDLFLLASGASDGHIAFNPPGSAVGSRTRVVELPPSTRRDNLSTFPSFQGRLDAVPDHGVTVGLGTIKDRSAEVLMLLHGQDKQLAYRHLSTAERFDPQWPATIVVECARARLFADRQAAAMSPSPAHR